MNNFIWKYKNHNSEEINKISKDFAVPNSIATIMHLKSITNKNESRSFFYSDLQFLHNPLLMLDMDKAISRVLHSQNNNELILIIGDYDADGTTAASVLYLYFKSINIDVEYYIPNRQTEGYGVSINAIDYAHKIGAKLIITCDCGITAIEQIEYAKKYNIDTIITDHHKQKDELPKAFAILNPNRKDCNYPFKGLCGAGVAFKLCLGINNELENDIQDVLRYTDLVAIATTADVVPIIDENRLIVKEGLKNIIQGRNKGIRALLRVSKLDTNSINVGKLGYWFIPKINAAGRLGDAARAVKLFTTDNPQFANEIAIDLENENEKRKLITMQHENDAKRIINDSINLDKDKIIILYKDDWHFGVVGIVASRVKELYNRPTIILSKEDGVYKGSCRSIGGYDIVNALHECSDILENYGGHPMAAGLSIKEKHLKSFCIRMNEYTSNKLDGDLQPIINIDYELKLSEINNRFIKFLDYLEPFGPGNSKPVFSTTNIDQLSDVQLVGKDRDTLKFTVHNGVTSFNVVGFRMIENYEKLLSDKPIDIAYNIDKNYWNNKFSTQLILKDLVYSNG
ncbi:single-stranded-DNA-specific exonuclease RecJ [bacterium]|nr:single-stranded-DNA-specific exonuclease RecJ [bacterium]